MSSIVAPDIAPTRKFEWRTILRHRWPLRLMHWINLLCMLAMVGSGLQILNAHPALYWGEASHFDTPLLATRAVMRGDELRGDNPDRQCALRYHRRAGRVRQCARTDRTSAVVPGWAMIPGSRDLATGRRWHFFFAWAWVINGLCYLAWSLASRHLQRDLAMRARRLAQHPALDPRPPALPPSGRRRGRALQPAAEARLPRR